MSRRTNRQGSGPSLRERLVGSASPLTTEMVMKMETNPEQPVQDESAATEETDDVTPNDEGQPEGVDSEEDSEEAETTGEDTMEADREAGSGQDENSKADAPADDEDSESSADVVSADSSGNALLVEVDESVETIRDLKASLSWALDVISHPAKQQSICNQHGKVPMTHRCSYFTNDEYDTAVERCSQ